MNKGGTVLFSEKQHFRQVWLWFIILIPTTTLWFQFYNMFKEGVFDKVLIIICIIAGIGLPALFYFTNLKTEIISDGIYFCFFPFHLKFHKIALSEIKKYQAVTYNPINDCGGWGIRWYGAGGKAYNVSGNRGVKVDLNNGSQILFGSQRPEEFVLALDKAMEMSPRYHERRPGI
ncbi:MAG: hypothetical protein ACOY31_01430 [Bacillota bacterium]